MAARVTALRVPFRGSRRREVFLDDERWDQTSATVVKSLGIAEGDEVQAAQLLEDILAAEPEVARERALRLLGYREHGRQELRRKLLDDGYHAQTADQICAAFARMGLLDDERFAAMLARTLLDSRHLGRSRARREMLARGIAEDLVDAVLDEHGDDELTRAVALARSWSRPGTEPRKLAARLMRRGYPSSVSYRAATTVCSGDEDAPDNDVF